MVHYYSVRWHEVAIVYVRRTGLNLVNDALHHAYGCINLEETVKVNICEFVSLWY